MLYSMPVGADKLQELSLIQARYPQVALRLMVDHAQQVESLQTYAVEKGCQWSVFVKVDGGAKYVQDVHHNKRDKRTNGQASWGTAQLGADAGSDQRSAGE